MRKSKKGFILLGITTSIIAANGIMQAVKPLKMNMNETNILEYNHNPKTALDNVFVEDNMTILPFIFSKTDQKITRAKIEEEFTNANLTIKNISTGDVIGTGTKITVNEDSTEYTVLVYGDVDGDGEVGFYDALDIIWEVNHPEAHSFEGIFFKAANLENSDNEIEFYDALRIIPFVNEVEGTKLVLNEPVSIKESRTLTKITAEYNDATPVSAATTLDQIKANVTVKAYYSNNDIEPVDTFELTGNLEAGKQNTLTITALGKTADITVTVDERKLTEITASYDNSTAVPATTTLEELKAKITVTGKYNNGTTDTIEAKDFTLVGNLEPGETNIITVKVQGKEDTIEVTVEEASVESITLEQAPTKNKYNYGEETLDLAGGKITVNWTVGDPTTLDLSNAKVTGYNPKQEGEQTLIVTYAGAETTFKVTVLNKISNVQITSEGRENVQIQNGNYKIESKTTAKDFVLGTIQPVNQDNTSTLKNDMIVIDIPEEYKDTLTVEKVVDANTGAIKLKVKATEDKLYTIKIAVVVDEEKTAELPITIQAVKNQTIGTFRFTQVGEQNYIQLNKPVRYEIIVKNENGEDIVPQNVEINGLSESEFIISKLDENGDPITNISDLKYIEIATTKKEQGVAQFTAVATGVDGKTKENSISLNVKAAPQISSVEIAEPNIQLYLEEQEGITDKDNLGNIYTVVDINFKDEEGNKIDVKEADIRKISADMLNTTTIEKGKIAIILPTAQIKLTVEDESIVYEGDGLNIKFYTDDKANITRMGISIIPDNDDEQIITASLIGKTIKFVNSDKTVISSEVPLSVNYKELQHLIFNKKVTEDQSGNYVVNTGANFTLGTVTTLSNEGPLTADMLTTVASDNGIEITFELIDGEIVVKGTATKAGLYVVQPCLRDNKEIRTPGAITVLAESNPQISDIILDNTNLEIGRFIKPTIKALSDLNPTNGEKLKIGDVSLDYNTDVIDVQFMSGGVVTDKSDTEAEISALQITNKSGVTTDTTTNLKITLYKDKPNVYAKDITISIYNAIPRKIDVPSSVTLYNSANENTVAVDGVNYTLVDINAFADSENGKTDKPITLLKNMLQKAGAEGTDKIYINVPQINVELWDGEELVDTSPDSVIQVEYFDKDKSPISAGTGEVQSIGFGIRQLDEMEKINPSDLNNVSITLKCIATGETKTITTSYTAP